GADRAVQPAQARIRPPGTGQPAFYPVGEDDVVAVGRGLLRRAHDSHGQRMAWAMKRSGGGAPPPGGQAYCLISLPRMAMPARIRSSGTVAKLRRRVLGRALPA